MSAVEELVRMANPIPDVDRYADVVGRSQPSLPDPGREHMEKIRRLDAQRAASWSPRRVITLAIAAAVVVIAAAGLFLVTLDGGGLEVAADGEALAVAEQWLERWGAGDSAGYEALMDRNATAECWDCAEWDWEMEPYFAGTRTFALREERRSGVFAAAGGTLSYSCRAVGSEVRCESLQSSLFDYEGSSDIDSSLAREFSFTVQDGLIVAFGVSSVADWYGLDPGLIADYGEWLATAHPEAHEELFYLGTLLVNEQSQIDSHRGYVAEWAAGL